jgi:hypothetical protein
MPTEKDQLFEKSSQIISKMKFIDDKYTGRIESKFAFEVGLIRMSLGKSSVVYNIKKVHPGMEHVLLYQTVTDFLTPSHKYYAGELTDQDILTIERIDERSPEDHYCEII